MKFKKWFGLLLSFMMACAIGVGISACGLTRLTPTEYVTVTWYDGEDVIRQNKEHVKGTAIDASEMPAASELYKEGFTFDDWYSEREGGTKFDFTKAIDENTDLYGRWTVNDASHVHQYGAWTVTEPTAEKTGLATRTCTSPDCDKSEGATQTVTLPVLGDERYQKGADSATCEAPGTQEYTFESENGDITFSVTTPTKAHTFDGTKWDHDDGEHWKICAVCGEADTAREEHTFTDGHCAICGAYEKYTLTFDLGYEPATGEVKPIEVYANETANLPGAPARADYNFTGWLCEADQKTYGANADYKATQDTKFTAQWTAVSADECAYEFYITGNGAGDLSRSGGYTVLVDDFRLTKTLSGQNTVYTFESIRIFKGDNFKVVALGDKSSPDWDHAFGIDALTGGSGKSDFERSEGDNIGATAYGRYKITLTVTKAGAKVSFTIDLIEAYVGTSQFKGWYLTGSMAGTDWKQAPTDYPLELNEAGTYYVGTFQLTASTQVKVIKVSATMIDGEEVGYTAEWFSYGTANGGNYTVGTTGWYQFRISKSASSSTKFTVTKLSEHTHSYTWEITGTPTAEREGSATGTCTNTSASQLPCDKKELTVTLPNLQDDGYTVTGEHSCTEQYTLHYSITVEGNAISFDVTAGPDGHVTDGTWTGDAVHHWHACKNCDTHVDEEEHTFEAHVCSACDYAAKSVTAGFTLGYGEGAVDPIVKYADEKVEAITLPTPEERIGYTFDGWLKDGAGEPLQGSYPITFGEENVTLSFTAKWTAIEYALKYESEKAGAALPGAPTATSFEENTTFTLDALTLAGYTFGGWYVGEEPLSAAQGKYTFTLTEKIISSLGGEEITLTARWQAITYTIAYAHSPALAEGESAEKMPEQTTVTLDEKTIALTSPERAGYHFLQWMRGNGDTVAPGVTTYKFTADKLPANGQTEITFTAQWEKISYTVKFTSELGGAVLPEGTKAELGDTIALTAATLKGYTFKGWQYKGQTYDIATQQLTLTRELLPEGEEIGFTAQWTAIEYTVHFDVNAPEDAATEIPPQSDRTGVTLEEGNNIIELPQLDGLDGYDFGGWTRGSTSGTPIRTETVTFTADMVPAQGVEITFYARWNAHGKVTVSFEYGDWTQEDDPASQSVQAGQSVTFPAATVTRTGYTFEGWRKSDEPEGQIHRAQESLAVETDATYNAVWTAVDYTVKFTGEGLTESSATVSLDTADENPFADPAARKGYAFAGWKFKGVKYTQLTAALIEAAAPVAENTITLTADWQVIEYTVEFSVPAPKEGIEVGEPPASASASLTSASFTLPAPTKVPKGYSFKQWTLGGKGYPAGQATFTEEMIPAEGRKVTFTAQWELVSYTLVFTDDARGTVSGSIEEVTLESGEHALPTPAANGYIFKGWKLNGSTIYEAGSPFTLTQELVPEEGAELTFAAVWEEKRYTVKFENDPAEAGALLPAAPAAVSLKEGEKSVTLDKLEDVEGYTFGGWYVGEEALPSQDEGETFTFTLTQDNLPEADTLTFTAKWEKLTKVTFRYDDSEVVKYYAKSVTKIPAEDFPAEVTDTATEKFVGWFDGDDGQYTQDTELNGDVELTAKFAKFVGVTWYVDGSKQHEVSETEKQYWAGMLVEENAYMPDERDEYFLDGWYTDGSFGEKYRFEDALTEEGLTLYARWLKEKITVRFFDEDGTEFEGQALTLDNGATPTLYQPADRGYTAKAGVYPIWEGKEWYLEAAHQTKYTNTALIEDTDLYLKWTEKSATACATKTFVIVGATSVNPKSSLKNLPAWTPSSATLSLQKDATLKYHTVYTITLDLYAGDVITVIEKGSSSSDWRNGANQRFGINNLTEAEKKYNGKAVISGNGTSDNNLQINAGGEGKYKFILAFNSTGSGYFTYELLEHYEIDHSEDKSGYFLVGSMTGWADAGCKPIYLGALTASGSLTVKVTITANDYQVNNGVKSDHAEAKVVTGTISGDVFVVTSWSVMGDANYSFPKNTTGTFRVTFKITSTASHTGTLSAEQIVSCTVSFSIGEEATGTPPQAQTADSGTKITLPTGEGFSREGYRFAGWSDGVTTHEPGAQYTVNETKVLTAVWLRQFTVEFTADDRDGGILPEGGTADEGNYLIPAGEPTRTGYTFAGWKAEADDTVYKNGGEHPAYDLQGNVTFKAEWEAIRYTLTFDEMGHGDEPEKITDLTLEGAQSTRDLGEYVLAAKGYDFKGWTLDAAANEEAEIISQFTLTEELIQSLEGGTTFTVYAVWTLRTYTIEIDHDPALAPEERAEGLGDLAGKQIQLEGAISLPEEAPTREGYTFSGFYIGGNLQSGEVPLREEMIADETTNKVVITVKWTKQGEVNVFFDAGGGELGAVPASVAVTENSDFTLPEGEPTRKGYAFMGWYIAPDEDTLYKYNGGEGFEASYQLAQEDVTFFAKWEAKEYTVRFVDDTHGQPQVEFTNVTAETQAKNLATEVRTDVKGYDVETWDNGEISIPADASFRLSAYIDLVDRAQEGVITLTAKWSATSYTVTFETAYGDRPDATTISMAENTIELKQLTAAGYLFEGWRLNGELIEETHYTLDLADIEVEERGLTFTAQWEVAKDVITITYNHKQWSTWGLADLSVYAYTYGGDYLLSGWPGASIGAKTSGKTVEGFAWSCVSAGTNLYTIKIEVKAGTYQNVVLIFNGMQGDWQVRMHKIRLNSLTVDLDDTSGSWEKDDNDNMKKYCLVGGTGFTDIEDYQ